MLLSSISSTILETSLTYLFSFSSSGSSWIVLYCYLGLSIFYNFNFGDFKVKLLFFSIVSGDYSNFVEFYFYKTFFEAFVDFIISYFGVLSDFKSYYSFYSIFVPFFDLDFSFLIDKSFD